MFLKHTHFLTILTCQYYWTNLTYSNLEFQNFSGEDSRISRFPQRGRKGGTGEGGRKTGREEDEVMERNGAGDEREREKRKGERKRRVGRKALSQTTMYH